MQTVLVVDDEWAVLSAIAQTLEGFTCRLITTTNPHQVLRILAAGEAIDLLITDIFMPIMDGETLLRKSRRLRPGLKVILTTGAASDQKLREWRARREVIISKPWLDEDFLTAVESALNVKPGDVAQQRDLYDDQ